MTYAPGEVVATPKNFAPSAIAGGAPPVVPAGTKFATRPAGITLGPGQSLHFTPGQGYWAGPAPAPPPSAPGPAAGYVMTPQQMQQDAGSQANAQVQGQVAPINQQVQQNTALGGAQDYQAGQFATAASKILGGIGPAAQQGYDTAAKDISSFAHAAGLGGLTPTLQDEQAGQQQFLSQVGQGGAQLNSAQALGNDLGLRQGFIPSNQLAQDAAATNTWAQGLKAVDVANAGARIQANDATTQANQAKLQSKIDAVAAKYPEYFQAAYKQDIVTSLKAIGIDDKSAQAAASLGEKYWHDHITSVHDHNVEVIALKAQGITLRRLALDQRKLNVDIKYKNGQLLIQGKNADANMLRAQTSAHGIDQNRTKDTGILWYKDGKPATVKGTDGKLHFVKVDPRIYSSSSHGALTQNSLTTKIDAWTQPVTKEERVPAVDENGKPILNSHGAPQYVTKSVTTRPAYTFDQAISELTNTGTDRNKALRAVWGNPNFRQQGETVLQAAAAGYIKEGWTYKHALADVASRGIFPRSVAVAVLKPVFAKDAKDTRYVKSMGLAPANELGH